MIYRSWQLSVWDLKHFIVNRIASFTDFLEVLTPRENNVNGLLAKRLKFPFAVALLQLLVFLCCFSVKKHVLYRYAFGLKIKNNYRLYNGVGVIVIFASNKIRAAP